MKLTDEEKDIIVDGLNMKKNYIETGTPILSAVDAKNCGSPHIVRVLSEEQHELINKIKSIREKIMSI